MIVTLSNQRGTTTMVDLNVPFIAQNYEFDCWYAALRMIWKFRHGNNAEPTGLETAEFAGMQRQSERDAIKRDLNAQGPVAVRFALRHKPPQGLSPQEFTDLAQMNGLVSPLLPPAPPAGGGFTFNQLESLLSVQGPLWCAFGYRHIVVLKGAALNTLYIHDPQAGANVARTVQQFNNLLAWTTPDCIMFLPGVPNAGAFA